MVKARSLIAALPFLSSIAALPCVQFDSSFNVYAFGGSQDVKLGQGNWAQPTVTPLTTSGRPPWTGNNTQCFLSQFNNAMYVLGADSSDYSKIYVYNFAGNSWSTQSTSSAPTAPSSRSAAILDHDTNVIFLYSSGGVSQLDLSTITTSASSSAIAWEGVGAAPWASGYSGSTVTAAESSNHILYFGTSGTSAGSAQIFVIHYAYFQPTTQAFTSTNGGSSFPNSGGQAFSVPAAGDDAQSSVVFIPNNPSNTYVVNHWTNPSSYSDTSGAPYPTNLINTTQTFAAPSYNDPNAAYAASPSSIVQITSDGSLYYVNNFISAGLVSSGATWSKMGYTLTGTNASGGSSNTNTASSTSSGSSASASGSGSTTSRSGTTTSTTTASGTGTSSAASGSATTSRAAAVGVKSSWGMGIITGVGMVGMTMVAGAFGVLL